MVQRGRLEGSCSGAPPAAGSAPAGRFWRIAFVALLVLNCLPLWIFSYPPSQDGPSHLHNAAVMADYAAEPVYRHFYRLTLFQPAGNLFTQFLLAILLKCLAPLPAAKLLLTGYVVLFFAAFRYLLGAVTPHAWAFSFAAGMLVSNYFLDMGFWNFSYSICFLMLWCGYYLRQHGDWNARQLTVLAAGGLMVYLTHAVSWAICLLAAAILGVALAKQRGALRRAMLPLFSLLPPACFFLAHWPRWQLQPVSAAGSFGLRARLWPFYSFPFLHTFGADRKPAVLVAAVLVLVTLAALGLRGAPFLLLGLACLALVLFGPDSVGSGLFIHTRVAFYACLFLLVWLALQAWPRPMLPVLALLFCGVSVALFAIRLPVLSRWDARLGEVVALGRHIAPGSTVLWLNLSRVEPGPDPYHDPVGLLSARHVIDLRNYEASLDHFLTNWQPGRAPVPALGGVAELGGVAPRPDLARYAKATGERVDYVIVQGNAGSSETGQSEAGLFPKEMAAYTLVASGLQQSLRLYQRTYQRNSPEGGDPAQRGGGEPGRGNP